MKPIFKTQKFRYVLCALVLFGSGVLLCQEPSSMHADQNSVPEKCGSNLLLLKNLGEDSSIAARLRGMQNVPKKYGANSVNSSQAAGPYIIPVVFHVITDLTNPTPAPSYARIQMQLASLNAAFSNSLNSINNVATGPRAANTSIQFCLAKKRWVGNQSLAWLTSSVGVVYHLVTNTLTSNIDITNNTSLATLAALTNAQYPPNMYLNIWCVPNISTSGNTNVNATPGVIGIGTFPWMTAPIDGIVMRNDCIGNNTYGNFPTGMFPPLDKGNILAHEVGHYLGLFHTFETIVGANVSSAGGAVGCYGLTAPTTDGDLVFDTPPTMINSQVPLGSYNTCNESYFPYGLTPGADVGDQIENFMSYSDDDYMNTFTTKQAERMWGALDNSWPTTFLSGQRTNLVSPANLVNTGVTLAPSCGPGFLNPNFNTKLIASALTCSTAPVQFFQPVMPGYLTATTHTWYFGDGQTSNALNPLHVYSIAPYNFTATLVVSDGTSISTRTLQVNIPTGVPEITDWTGRNTPVCRGSDQTIIIKFPPFIQTAVLTDGVTTYVVNSRVVVNQSVYHYPFTFTITSSGTWSLVLGSCATSSAVATFTVVDCCNNLVYNGDMEAGPVGYTSDYTLTTNNYSGGFAAISNMIGLFTVMTGTNNKQFMIDSWDPVNGCNNPSIRKLLLGQTITGLQPNADYYISYSSTECVDSVFWSACSVKYNLRFFCASAPGLLSENVIPCNDPPPGWVVPGGSGQIPLQTYCYKVTTPGSINATTVFSLELYEVDNRSPTGFDDVIDNLVVRRLNGAISLSPVSSTVAACSNATVQLNATSACSNIANYTLVWQPTAGLSCTNCPNPVATIGGGPVVYTLIAIPPITVPPTPNVVLTSTIFAPVQVSLTPVVSSVIACPSGTVQLNAFSTCTSSGAYTFTWLPPAGLSCTSCPAPVASVSVTTVYTLIASPVVPGQSVSMTSTVYAMSPTVSINVATLVPCFPPTYSLSVNGAVSAVWQPVNTNSVSLIVSPLVPTTYSVTANLLLNQQLCPTQTVVSVTIPLQPSITASAQRTVICFGESVTLTGAGVSTYSWSGPQAGSTIAVSPQQNTTYTVQGWDLNGCPSNTASVRINVVGCSRLFEIPREESLFLVSPNPNQGQFSIRAFAPVEIRLFSALGQLIGTYRAGQDNNYTLEITGISKGVYFISGISEAGSSMKKIVVGD